MIPENIYGVQKRLHFIMKNIDKSHRILEFGCGTGYMITFQLLQEGYNVKGCDLDKGSIELGQKALLEAGFDKNRLMCTDISDISEKFDVIIASEVFEHLDDITLKNATDEIISRLNEGGLLIVTVPNGYGCFEIEDFLWKKCKIGNVLSFFYITKIIGRLKKIILGNIEPKYPFSLDSSKHLQRFTFNSIQKFLKEKDMTISEITGSVMFAGPFSTVFLNGFRTIMKINCKLGDLFPKIASGYYIISKKN